MSIQKFLVAIMAILASAWAMAVINLNTATSQQLQELKGIGASKAADIIAYRQANSGFKSVDDLLNVKGIGKKTLDNIRSELTVSGTAQKANQQQKATPATSKSSKSKTNVKK